jgi:predicted transposase YbfD/YdcC
MTEPKKIVVIDAIGCNPQNIKKKQAWTDSLVIKMIIANEGKR